MQFVQDIVDCHKRNSADRFVKLNCPGMVIITAIRQSCKSAGINNPNNSQSLVCPNKSYLYFSLPIRKKRNSIKNRMIESGQAAGETITPDMEYSMTPAAEIRKRAIELIEQLPPERLAAIVQLLEFLSEPALPNAGEAALVEIIQRQLPSAQQQRLEELRDRCEWGELNDQEQQELIQYEDTLEQWQVERLEALMELAKLRNVDLLTLNRQFLSESQSLHAV